MKKLVLGALCIVLGFAANVAMATQCQIGDLRYNLDDSTKTAEVCDSMTYMMTTLTDVKIPASVTYMSQDYAVTSIGHGAFVMYSSLESVSAPYVTSIGENAFVGCSLLASVFAPCVTSIGMSAFSACNSLASLTVNSEMQSGWDLKKSGYGIDGSIVNPDVTFLTMPPVKVEPNPAANSTAKVYTNGVEVMSNPVVVLSNAWVDVVFTTEDNYCFADDHSTTRTNTVQATDDPTTVPGPKVVRIPSLSEEVAQQAAWEMSLKSGDQEIGPSEYADACAFYGLTPKTAPQVVKEGEIAVTKESLQAAKAETVEIMGGQILLGVSVLSNSDITASTAWAPVKFPAGTQIDISTDGTKLGIPVPVSAQSGFMILQSGNAVFNEFITQPGTPDTPSGPNVNPVVPDPTPRKMN